MDKSKEKAAGPYRERLHTKAKARYLDKIKGIRGIDPYEHLEWTEDRNLLPNFKQRHLYNYMVLGVSAYSNEVFRNIRSVQMGHVHYTGGWVHDPMEMFQVDSKTIVRAKVNHSMRTNLNPLQPWVILRSSGEVESAHCTCMAGVAEKCLHVAALLYKVDTAVQLRGNLTPTDVAAYWVEPASVKKVSGAPGHTIDYTTGAARKKALDHATSGQPSATCGIRTRPAGRVIAKHTLGDLTALLTTMHEQKSVLCSVLPEYSHLYKDPVPPCILPKSLLCFRNQEMDGCELSVLLQHSDSLRPQIAVTETEAASLERQTREQHKSSVWRTARAGRITASNISAVVSTPLSSPALSTVKKVCYPQKTYSTANREQDEERLTPMEWGRVKEDTARESYRMKHEQQHEELNVEKCGFIVNPSFPELGASPDALVHCVCCGKGCVEIKCPHKHRDHTIYQACEDRDFCLQFTSGKLQLKHTHAYYKQVQTQLLVTGAQYCDFVIWTRKTCESVRVTPDAELWETTLLPKAQSFFWKVALPELVACHYTQQSSTTAALQPIPESQPPPDESHHSIHTHQTKKRTQQPKKRAQGHTSRALQEEPAESQPVCAHQPKKRARKTKVELWCCCRQPEDGVMVACDNKENCDIQWYHLACVGLSQAPAEDEVWYCPACTLN